MKRWVTCLLGCLGAIWLAGCTSNSPKKHYVLAEKLWNDANYAAAVVEFDKVIAKDPQGKLGLQALFRSATTESLFLSRYDEAMRRFKLYGESPGAEPELAWEAKMQIGDIFYSKTGQYDRAIQQYQMLLKEKPAAPEAPEFEFRVAKSYFFLHKFAEAVSGYKDLIKRYPTSPWAEKASYEIGVAYFTSGEQHSDVYEDAITAFESFIKRYPQSDLVPQARFGVASCLEELDQLDVAYKTYQSLKSTFPSPNVIEIKLARIRERKAQRNR